MKLDEALLQRAVPIGSMRYYAWLYAPVVHREVIAAVFLLEAELHDTARAAHAVAHLRLQWWREELANLSAGKARHPATQVLQAAAHIQLDAGVLNGLLASTAQELANVTYETDTELDQYLRGGLGGLFALAAAFLAPQPNRVVLDAATQLGAFVRQVETSRDLREDFHLGRLYLPLAALDELDIEYQALQSEHWPVAFEQWLQTRSHRALHAYHDLRQGLSAGERRSLRPLLVLGDLHAQILARLAADPARQTRQRIELSPLQKLWSAWRSARSAR